MIFDVVYRERAEADLVGIFRFVRSRSGSVRVAQRSVERLKQHCDSLSEFPERGTRREELGPGLRTFGIERRTTVVFRIVGDQVEIMRVLYGGRDVEAATRNLR